jgi:hypothetical protein
MNIGPIDPIIAQKAATKIQAHVRGHLVRKKVAAYNRKSDDRCPISFKDITLNGVLSGTQINPGCCFSIYDKPNLIQWVVNHHTCPTCRHALDNDGHATAQQVQQPQPAVAGFQGLHPNLFIVNILGNDRDTAIDLATALGINVEENLSAHNVGRIYEAIKARQDIDVQVTIDAHQQHYSDSPCGYPSGPLANIVFFRSDSRFDFRFDKVMDPLPDNIDWD